MHLEFGQNIIDKIRGKKKTKTSFSQSGEDIIVSFIFKSYLNIKKINYLDIGANHSSQLSNTKYFYDKGCSGVLIEPDPILFKEIKNNRSKDICLNCGIGVDEKDEVDFYIIDPPTLSTFSKESALNFEKENNYKINKVIKMKLININNVLKKYFSHGLDFLSLDIEGLDFDVLKSIDFNAIRPKVICVETLSMDDDRKKQHKENDIIDFLKDNNYFVYADTFINTIFVDKNIW